KPIKKKASNGKIKFLHLSSLKNDHKNIQGMLNIVKKLVEDKLDFEFHIGGTGDAHSIEEFSSNHHLEKTIFTFSALQYNQVAQKLNQFDAFILFSNYENQPCVQSESFACGLPFIATNVGGIAEFFPENFGIILEKGDEEGLFNAMKEVITGKEFAEKYEMHQYAVNNFSSQVLAQRFDKVYNQVLLSQK